MAKFVLVNKSSRRQAEHVNNGKSLITMSCARNNGIGIPQFRRTQERTHSSCHISILSEMLRLDFRMDSPILEMHCDLELRHCLLARRPRSWLISVDQIDTTIQDLKRSYRDLIVDESTCGES